MNFDTGKQPCDTFKAQLESNEYAMWENLHECFCKQLDGNYCAGKVSYCENCHKDHHSNGYDTCPCHKEAK